MKRIMKLMFLATVISLYGCSTHVPVSETEKPFTMHPTMPKPVTPRNVKFEVVAVEDEKPYVRMNMADYQKLGVYMEDVLRYVRNINGVVCFYRHDLNENFCKSEK